MKLSLLCLLLVVGMLFAQDPNQTTTAETPKEPTATTAETPKEPAPTATAETAEPANCQTDCAKIREESRKFWLGMNLKEIVIAIAILAQILERLFELLLLGCKNFKTKTLVSFFGGIAVATGICYLTQIHILLDRMPSIQPWNEYVKLVTMAFIIYCCTQPLHRLLARKSSADIAKAAVGAVTPAEVKPAEAPKL